METKEYISRFMQPRKMQQIREAKGLSRSEVSRRAEVQPSLVGWIETGRYIPYRTQLVKVAAALGVDESEAETLLEPIGDSNGDTH